VARPSVTTLRTRTGGGLRVYLKRGWYSSGDGELLGVVLTDQPWLTWPIDLNAGLVVSEAARVVADQAAQRLFDRQLIAPRGQANLAATERLVRGAGLTNDEIATASTMSLSKLAAGLQGIEAGLSGIIGQLLAQGIDPDKLVTHWGRDPLWGAALPAGGPFIHQFPLRTAVGTGLSLQETTKATVTVVGHTPRYDPTRGLWYCDIQVDAGSSYTPFVRLALCRYQPWSIDDAHLSRVVLADFAQLLPERRAAFTRRAGAVSVSVSGPGSYTSVATRLTGTPDGPVGDGLSRRMGATVQRLPAGADPDLGWVDTGDEITLAATTTSGLGAVTWAGTVPVPDAPAGTTQRVLVREYELLETDPDPEDPLGATRLIHSGPVEFPTVVTIRQRVVYADTFLL
jgi:hypothetical protein